MPALPPVARSSRCSEPAPGHFRYVITIPNTRDQLRQSDRRATRGMVVVPTNRRARYRAPKLVVLALDQPGRDRTAAGTGGAGLGSDGGDERDGIATARAYGVRGLDFGRRSITPHCDHGPRAVSIGKSVPRMAVSGDSTVVWDVYVPMECIASCFLNTRGFGSQSRVCHHPGRSFLHCPHLWRRGLRFDFVRSQYYI